MSFNQGNVERAIFYWIYSFHMPLFIFISGYFTKVGQKTNKAISDATHFLSLFVFFNLFMWLVIPREVNYRSLLTPQYAMWYLLSMFYWKSAVIFLSDIFFTKRNLIWITIVSCIIGFVPFISEMLSFNRTICFACFFAAGIMARKYDLISRIRNVPLWVALSCTIGSLIFVISFYHYGLRYVYSNSYNFHALPFIERCLNMLMASMIGISLIRISQLRFPHWVSYIGQKTLFIYLYHTFFIALFPYIARYLHFTDNILTSLLSSIVIIVLLLAMSKITLFEKFLKINIFKNITSRFYN